MKRIQKHEFALILIAQKKRALDWISFANIQSVRTGNPFKNVIWISLKSIWHEHSFLSVNWLLLKNSKLKVWENSDKTTRSYDCLNLPIFRSKFGPFCCSAKTWSRDQKRNLWRHLVGSSTASARKHNKYKGGYRASSWLQKPNKL